MFHIIMPFHRGFLLETLKKDIGAKRGVMWHPVCDPDEIKLFDGVTSGITSDTWISPLLCDYLTIPGDQCYRKINDFIEAGKIIDSDYYGFLGDDDMYAPGFIEKILKFVNAKIIVFSMSRGDHSPPTDSPYQWPAIPLYQHRLDDIRVANIDLCQMIVKGEILRQTRFGNNDVCDDGNYAVNLKNQWPDEILTLSEIGVFKSFYEPGRYDTDINTPRVR